MAKGLNATGGVADQVGLNHLEIDIVKNDQETELFINASAYIWDDREVGILVIFFYSGDTLGTKFKVFKLTKTQSFTFNSTNIWMSFLLNSFLKALKAGTAA